MEKALLLYWWQRFAGLRSLGKLGGPPRHTEATVRYTQGVRALMKTGGHAVSVQGGLWHQKDPGGHKAPEGKASRGGVAPRGQAACSSERQCGWSCVTAATTLRQGCEVGDRRHVSGKFWNQNITPTVLPTRAAAGNQGGNRFPPAMPLQRPLLRKRNTLTV